MPEKSHPFVEFFVIFAENMIALWKGEDFERGTRPPRWLRRLRLVTFPIYWVVTGLAAMFAIGLMLLVLVSFEGVPVWVKQFKEAWDNA